MKHRAPRIILLLAGAAGLAWWGITRLGARGELPANVIAASGTVEATEMDVSARVPGRIVRLLVDEGDPVKAGQVIATLDSEDLQAQVDQAKGGLASAQAQLRDLQKGSREEQIRQARAEVARAAASRSGAARMLRIARESLTKSSDLKAQLAGAQSGYDSARNSFDQARAKRELVEAGPRSETIDQAAAAVSEARARSRNAEEDARRAQDLFAAGAISAQQRDAAVTQRDAAAAALESAQSRLAELRRGARPEEIQAARSAEAVARAQMDGAKRTLEAVRELFSDRLSAKQQVEALQSELDAAARQEEAAKAQLDLLVNGPTPETLDAARGRVGQAAGGLAAAETQLGHAVVVAATDGVVTDRFREPGEFVAVGTPLVRIASLDRVWLRVYAPLPALGKIRVGDRAAVTADTYPGKEYVGRVASISQEPEFTPKNVQTTQERVKLVFSVRIDLDNRSRELKPGMPADARIATRGERDGD